MVVYSFMATLLLIILVWYISRIIRNNTRKKLLATPLTVENLLILQQNVSLYKLLPQKMQTELQGLINVFLNEKKYFGYEGLYITDEIRITIAAHACILLLNRKTNYYPHLTTIMVYPSAYIAKESVFDGELKSTVASVRAGESWHRGPIVLSWDDARHGAFDPYDGKNVILHEFAHQLDQENDSSDGAPVLEHRSQYVSWARILGKEYQQLQSKVANGQSTVIDHYGATTPAEFFAVVSETFFERPADLKREHPELYDEFKKYYKLDPVNWC